MFRTYGLTAQGTRYKRGKRWVISFCPCRYSVGAFELADMAVFYLPRASAQQP
jgi:hypothetical protein